MAPAAVAILALGCLLAAADPGDASAATARVQYLSSANVYLDAGSAEGLAEGTAVIVKRSGAEVARLVVVYVSEHSASCRVESSAEPIRVGDVGSFTPAAPSDSAASRPGPGGPGPMPEKAGAPGASALQGNDRSWSQPRRVSGSVMTLYTRTSANGGSYENPAVRGDVRWRGPSQEEMSLRFFGARPVSRAVTDLPGVEFSETKSRVYEAAAFYRNPRGSLEATGGRFLVARLEGLGYVDGGSVAWRAAPGLNVGAAGGRGSDLGVAGFGSQGVRMGAWLEAGDRASSIERRWRLLVSSGFQSDSSLTRREYAAERFELWPRRRTVLYQSVEVDYNPGWKQALGERAVTLTAWSVGGSSQIQPRLWATLAFDSRRSFLLPEQRYLPALQSLDRYTGFHTSSRYDLSSLQSVWVGGSVRRRDLDGKTYKSWDAGWNSRKIVADRISGGVHAFGYDDGTAQGLNADASLAARLYTSSALDLSGGYGTMWGQADAPPVPAYRSRWIRTGLDVRLPSGPWVRVAHEWQGGQPGNEITAELGLVF